MRCTLVTLVLLLAAGPASTAAEERTLELAIGDPARSDRFVPVTIDALTDTRSGEVLDVNDLAARLEGVRLLLVGESHTDIEFHRIQLRLLRALHESGRQVLLGLEMYPYTEQKHLDGWIDGSLTEEGFLEASRWYHNWSYNWLYYRDIFLAARELGVGVYAINTPREIVQAVRKKGFQNLTEEEAAHLPATIDMDNDEHRRLFKSYFDADDPLHASMSDEQWEGMFNAQCTWDATMAYNAVRALEAHGGPDSILVVLAGSGHVAFGLGIQRQAAQWFDGRIATLIPVPVRDLEGEPTERVRASYADLVWGLPPEAEPLYPSLGLSVRDGENGELSVIFVSEETAAADAGFAVGDQLVALDGTQLTSKEMLNRLLAGFAWGDRATFDIRRDGAAQRLTVHFRRRAIH